MKILDTRWFCGRTDVGIVRVEDPHDGIKYYISGFLPTTEAADSKHIADWGQPFPVDAGNVLFGITQVTIPVSEDHARSMVTIGLQYLTEMKYNGKI
jgi:hypothetical protein